MSNSFGQCISDICGLEISALAAGIKYSVFNGNVAVVEGHGGIVDYSTEKVDFFCGKSDVLEICGTNLRIRCLEKHYAVVEGKISGVAVKHG